MNWAGRLHTLQPGGVLPIDSRGRRRSELAELRIVMGIIVIGLLAAAVLVAFGLLLWRRADAGGRNHGSGQSRLAAIVAFAGAAAVVTFVALSA